VESEIELSVVVPAFNESARIGASLQKICRYLSAKGMGFEIIVVDDGSTDDTAEKVRTAAAGDCAIRLVSYAPNRGKGRAVKTGMLTSRGRRVLMTDADLSAPIEDLHLLSDAMEDGCEVAIGSRGHKDSIITTHQPLYRELGGKMVGLAIRTLAVRGIKDSQCGFKLFDGDFARRLFEKSVIDGYACDVEALYLAARMGGRIREVAIHWGHCEGSKVRPFADAIGILGDICRILLTRYQNP
jgi:dolichyl-phosphate beta-glucosyltransferase